VAVVVAVPQVLLAAEEHRQPPRLAGLVPHQQQAPRHAEPVPRRRRAALRPLAERRLQLAAAAVVEVAVAVVMRPAHQTPMAPSTLHSSRWLAMPTACRRCSSGRRI